MNFYSWVQSGLGADLDDTLYFWILVKSKVSVRGPRMIPKEQWLVMERQSNVFFWQTIGPLSQRGQLHSCLTIGSMKSLMGFEEKNRGILWGTVTPHSSRFLHIKETQNLSVPLLQLRSSGINYLFSKIGKKKIGIPVSYLLGSERNISSF